MLDWLVNNTLAVYTRVIRNFKQEVLEVFKL